MAAYHHGNLREALIKSALESIAEVGIRGFTLREVARRAGVSHNAPYRHFRDREDLLAAVAAEGFERLTDSMKREAGDAATPYERLHASGRGYVAFALANPEHFVAMFERPVSADISEQVQSAGERAFGTLVDFVAACQTEGTLPAADPSALALLAWASVHGVAKLATAGRLGLPTKEATYAFTRRLTEAVMRGMLSDPPSRWKSWAPASDRTDSRKTVSRKKR